MWAMGKGLSTRHCVRVLLLGNEPGMQSTVLASHGKNQLGIDKGRGR